MKKFIKSININVWKIIIDGPFVPTEEGQEVGRLPKTKMEYDENE